MNIQGNITSTSATINNRATIGAVFTYSWASNPLTTWTNGLSTTVATADGTKTNFNGGAFNLNNSLSLTSFLGAMNYTISQRITIKEKSSTSFGLGIQIKPATTGATSQFIHFLLDTATGYIAYTSVIDSLPSGTSISNSSTTSFKWAVNDVIDLSIRRRGRDMVIRMTNITTPDVSELVISGTIAGAVGNLKLYFYGGQYDFIGNFTITYDDILKPTIALIGDSISYGTGATDVSTTWFNIMSQYVNGGTVLMAAGFEQSIDGTRRITDVATYLKPKYLLVSYGVNDFLQGVSTATFNTRLTTIVTTALASGITPILLTLFPQVSGDVTPYNNEVQAVATANSIQVVDIFTIMKGAGTAPATNYLGDTVHPNPAAHIVWGNSTHNAISSLLTEPPVFSISGITPAGTGISKLLAIGEGGTIISTFPGTDPGYIHDILSTNVTTNGQQTASISIGGRFVHFGSGTAGLTDFIIQGNGSLANPNFKVQAGTVTAGTFVAATISSANFSTSGTQTLYNGGTILEANDPAHRTTSINGFSFKNTASSNFGFTVDQEVAQGSGYISQRWRHNGTTMATLSRDGNFATSGTISSGTAGSTLGSLLLSGNTSGTVTIKTAAVAGTWTFTLPIDDGTNGQLLTTDGNGVTSWTSVSGLTNPMTTTGDVIYSSNNSGTPARLAIGSTNQVLTVVGGVPTWQNSAAGFSNPMTTLGDIITGGSSGTPQRLAAGTDGFVLTLASGVPTWAVNSGGGANTALSNLVAVAINTSLLPGTDDGAALGSTSKEWSDLFLASGSVINYANGNYTVTHSSSQLNLSASANVFTVTSTGGSQPALLTLTGGPSGYGHIQASIGDFYLTAAAGGTNMIFRTANTERWRIDVNGNFTNKGGAGSAYLNLKAGSATASTAPLKFTSGPLNTTAEVGAIEFLTDNPYFTITTGAARKEFTLNDASLTSGRVPFATTNGRLTDNANMTFSTGLGLGASGSSSFALVLGGTGWSSGVVGMVGASVSATAGSSPALMFIGGTIIEAASGTHTYIAGLNVDAPTITSGVATVTNAATLRINGATSATVTGGNYALWVAAGASRFDGSVDFGANTITNYAAAYNIQTGTTYTLVAADMGKIVTLNNGSGITLTVPSGLPAGFSVTIIQLGAGQVTIAASGTTVNNRQSHTKIAGQYGAATLVQYTTNVFALSGDTSA